MHKMFLIVLFYLFSLSLSVEKESAFDETNKRSVSGLDALPSFGQPSLFEYAKSSNGDIELMTIGKILLFGPAGLFTVLWLLTITCWFPWCCGRTCCKNKCCSCCCKQKRHTKKLTCCQKYSPFIFLILFLLLIIAFAGIGYVANINFSDALVDEEEGLLYNIEDLGWELEDFLNSTITSPLTFVKRYSISAINDVSQTIGDGSDTIISGTNNLKSELYTFSRNYANKTLIVESNSKNYTFSCDVCTSIVSVVNDTADFIKNSTDPIFLSLNDTFNGLTNDLIDLNETIQEILGGVATTIENMTANVDEFFEDFEDDYAPMVESVNNWRELGYNILFAFPLIPIVFVVFGFFLAKSCLFTVSYISMWCSCCVMFFMLIIHFPIAMLLNDVCNELDIIDSNVTDYMGNTTASKVINACQNDSSIVAALGKGKYLEFTEIEFPSFNVTDIISAFNFSELDSLRNELGDTDTSTFGGEVDDLLDEVNTLVSDCGCGNSGDYFDRDNISILVTTNYYTQSTSDEILLANLTNTTITYIDVETSAIGTFNDTIYDMIDDLKAIQNLSDILEVDVIEFFNLTEESQSIMDPVLEKADIVADGSCLFIADKYYDIKSNFCDTILSSLATMIVCMMVIGFSSVFACICAVKMVRKIDPSYRKDLMQDETTIIALGQTGQVDGNYMYDTEM